MTTRPDNGSGMTQHQSRGYETVAEAKHAAKSWKVGHIQLQTATSTNLFFFLAPNLCIMTSFQCGQTAPRDSTGRTDVQSLLRRRLAGVLLLQRPAGRGC